MNENELHERYIRLAFQYESAIDALLTKGLVDIEAADAAKERFYDTIKTTAPEKPIISGLPGLSVTNALLFSLL